MDTFLISIPVKIVRLLPSGEHDPVSVEEDSAFEIPVQGHDVKDALDTAERAIRSLVLAGRVPPR